MRFLILPFYLLLSHFCLAQLQFDDQFDNGRVDSSYFAGDAHVLAPITNLHVRVTGLKDSTPIFKMYDFEGYRLRTYHRMVYRYAQDSVWHFFDQGIKSGSVNYYYFQNNTAFLHDTVFIAYWYPWTWQNQQEFIQRIDGSSPYLRNLSAKGHSIENRPLWGYEITDTSFTDCYKQKVVFTARQHPTENINGYFVRGLTKYLLYAQDSTAAYLRKHYRFFIYPMLNPDGVFHGIGQNLLGQGLNRDWNPGLNPGGCPEIDSIRPYIWAETGGHVDYAIDIHSNPGSNIRYYWWGITSASGLAADSVARALAYVQSVARQDAIGGQGLFQNQIQGNGINGSFTAGNWFFNTMGAHAFTFEPTSEPISMTSDQIPASRMEMAGAALAKGFEGLFQGTEPMKVELSTDSLSAWVTISGGVPPYTILWDDPQMQTGDTLTAVPAGIYQVTVTDANGCKADQTVFLQGANPIGNLQQPEAHLFPNPAQGEVILQLSHPVAVRIWNTEGRIVKNLGRKTAGKHLLQLSGLAEGLYWFEMEYKGKYYFQPLVVQ